MSQSNIHYHIQERPSSPVCVNESNPVISWKLPGCTRRVVFYATVQFDIHNTGVTVLAVYGKADEKNTGGNVSPVFSLHTEGAFLYTYDRQKKIKLRHFESDTLYGVYVVINPAIDTYQLFVDGERLWTGKLMTESRGTLSSLSMRSHDGTLLLKKLFVYDDPVPSIDELREAGHSIINTSSVPSDGKTVVTEQLQELIFTCSRKNAVLYFPAGTYLTGHLELKENVTLYLEEGATLKGTLDIQDYPTRLSATHPNWNTMVQGPQKALLYADDQDNLRILGRGTIDGSGDFPGAYGSESDRPSLILLVGCDKSEIAGVYITNAGMWTVPVVECHDLYIHDINLYSTWYPNRDGIDLCDCHHVLVEMNQIQADDDAICFKSGNDCGCNDIQIRDNMIISTMANGIKFGTYSYGGFQNCTCEDCIVKDTRTCALAIQCVDGGRIENLVFRRIDIQNIESVFFIIIADKGRVPTWGTHRIGSIEHILFEDIEAAGVRRSYGSYLGGFQKGDTVYPIRDITFRRVHVIYQGGVQEQPPEPPEFENQYPESNVFGILPGAGYYIRHAEDISFDECHTELSLPDARELFFVNED